MHRLQLPVGVTCRYTPPWNLGNLEKFLCGAELSWVPPPLIMLRLCGFPAGAGLGVPHGGGWLGGLCT